jgi:hypothetical protein
VSGFICAVASFVLTAVAVVSFGRVELTAHGPGILEAETPPQTVVSPMAPSDYLEFAAFLVERGIDSISLSADALVRTTLRILEVEAQRNGKRARREVR